VLTRERPTLEAVSRATVSRVVNGSTSAAASIREAVDEPGYVPNPLPGALLDTVILPTESVVREPA
jgi:DNA-binding LacI/PurR family transcriptional regulator